LRRRSRGALVDFADLKIQRFTLGEMAKEPQLIERIVREHLRGIMYHNLRKVDALYRIALEFRLLDLAADKDSLFAAVLLRHDCVHRNGSDLDKQAICWVIRTLLVSA
jgi:hypothetical protein